MKRNIYIFILTYYCIINYNNFNVNCNDNKNIFQVTKIECEGNEKYAKNVNCSLRATNNSVSLISVETDLLRKQNDIQIKLNVYRKPLFYGIFKQNILSITFEVCKVKNKHISNVITNKILKFSEYGNWNKTCPYLPIHYYLRNFPFNGNNFPFLIPNGDYKFDIIFGNKIEHFIMLKVFATYSNRN